MTLPGRADINGAAIYRHHGQEQYLALLHLPDTTTSAEAALRQSGVTGTAMEFVVLAPSISSRRLSRHWRESVVVNVDRAAIEANIDALSQLSGLLRGELKYGDKLTLSARLGGLDVALNRVHLGTLAAPDLLLVMLQIWLGPVPPSSSFRRAMLSDGAPEEALLSRYLTTVVPSQRRAEIKQQWLSPAQPSLAAAVIAAPIVVAESNSERPTETPTTTIEKPRTIETPTVAESTRATVEAPSLESLPVESAPIVAADGANSAAAIKPVNVPIKTAAPTKTAIDATETATESPTLLAAAAPVTGLQLPQLTLASATSQVVEPKVEAADSTLAEGRELALAESAASVPVIAEEAVDAIPEVDPVSRALLASKGYYDEIKERVYRQVSYPTVALRNGRESEVALQLKIDAAGELLAVDVSDGSRYKYFNKAAVRAASPFGAPPRELTEDGVYQIKMQVNFRINGDG